MTRVRILRAFVDLRPGDELTVSDDIAAQWAKDGRAEIVQAKALNSASNKAVAAPAGVK